MHINCQHLLTSNEMEDVLKDIGYSIANNIDWDIDEMIRELTAGNPVILKGADNLFTQHYWTALGFIKAMTRTDKSVLLPQEQQFLIIGITMFRNFI